MGSTPIKLGWINTKPLDGVLEGEGGFVAYFMFSIDLSSIPRALRFGDIINYNLTPLVGVIGNAVFGSLTGVFVELIEVGVNGDFAFDLTLFFIETTVFCFWSAFSSTNKSLLYISNLYAFFSALSVEIGRDISFN